nr:MAG TPA: beta-sandwich protein [Caudoviricetes sp.]DAK26884.1 MAG TPA: beta-sandwich protein [Caudoviricetes sp.]
MPSRILVITKTHDVSCNIGIAYTVPSYSVSKVLHNCF